MFMGTYTKSEVIILVLILILFTVIVYIYFNEECDDDDDVENFGALQSLYSNDGIQDAYLTIENDPTNPNLYDPYAYWRGVTWNLPTRNLHRAIYYPYLYEYYIDRYSRFYPYW